MAVLTFLMFLVFIYLLVSLIRPKKMTFGLLEKRKFVLLSAVGSLILMVVLANQIPAAGTAGGEPRTASAQAKTPAPSAEDKAAKKKAEEEAKQQAKSQAEADAKAKKEADEKAKTEAAAQKEADAKAKAEADAQAKTEADAKAKADAEAKAPHLGDMVPVGNLSVGVGKNIKTSQSVGNQLLNRQAQGTFWIFPVGIKNNDQAARMIDAASMFELIAVNGTKYQPDNEASMYINDQGKFFLQSINPGIQSEGYIVFDMPPDAVNKLDTFKLRVYSGVGLKGGSNADFILKSR